MIWVLWNLYRELFYVPCDRVYVELWWWSEHDGTITHFETTFFLVLSGCPCTIVLQQFCLTLSARSHQDSPRDSVWLGRVRLVHFHTALYSSRPNRRCNICSSGEILPKMITDQEEENPAHQLAKTGNGNHFLFLVRCTRVRPLQTDRTLRRSGPGFIHSAQQTAPVWMWTKVVWNVTTIIFSTAVIGSAGICKLESFASYLVTWGAWSHYFIWGPTVNVASCSETKLSEFLKQHLDKEENPCLVLSLSNEMPSRWICRD